MFANFVLKSARWVFTLFLVTAGVGGSAHAQPVEPLPVEPGGNPSPPQPCDTFRNPSPTVDGTLRYAVLPPGWNVRLVNPGSADSTRIVHRGDRDVFVRIEDKIRECGARPEAVEHFLGNSARRVDVAGHPAGVNNWGNLKVLVANRFLITIHNGPAVEPLPLAVQVAIARAIDHGGLVELARPAPSNSR